MKYTETKGKKKYELEILNDGVKYSKQLPDENSTNFISFETIGDNTNTYSINYSTWAESYNYKYFLVIALGFGLFSLLATGHVGLTAYLFLFVALVFWAIIKLGTEQMVSLESVGYGGSIIWFKTNTVNSMFEEIRNKRNTYLKEKYLNEDGSLKNIFQNEQTIRNMSLFGLVDNSLVATVEEHNKKIRDQQTNNIDVGFCG